MQILALSLPKMINFLNSIFRKDIFQVPDNGMFQNWIICDMIKGNESDTLKWVIDFVYIV